MFIANFMTAPPRTVTADVLLPEARELMSTGNFRHLPVVDENGCLVGIITDRDLRSAFPDGVLNDQEKDHYMERYAMTPVRTVMTEAVNSLQTEATLDDALVLFDRTRVGALPVLDPDRRVVGILSVRDLLTAYRQLFGLGEKGSSLISIADDGDPRLLTRLTAALETGNIPFSRLIRTGEQGGQDAVIYVRVHTNNLNNVHKTLTGAGLKTKAPGMERSRDHA